MLRTTANGLTLIEAFEGLRTKAYLCPAGVPTIGIGHTSQAGGDFTLASGAKASKVALGQEITATEARRLFAADIDRFEDQVEQLIAKAKVAPSPCEFDALVSLAYNIGTAAFKGSTVLRKFLAGDKAGAADAMLAWNKATVNGRKVVVKGLVRGDSAMVGSGLIYAGVHQAGATIKPQSARRLAFQLGNRLIFAMQVVIPARPFLGVSADNAREIMETTADFVRRRLGL